MVRTVPREGCYTIVMVDYARFTGPSGSGFRLYCAVSDAVVLTAGGDQENVDTNGECTSAEDGAPSDASLVVGGVGCGVRLVDISGPTGRRVVIRE